MKEAQVPTPSAPESGEELDRSGVKSLAKALDLLEQVASAEHPLTIAEAALRTGISRPTAYRLVQTLAARDYLFADPLDGRISIGLSVLPPAAALLDSNQMRLEALPHLHALAQRTGERVNLGILHRCRVLYLAGIEKPSLPTIYSRFGHTAPAHCCSLGKAILAHLPEAEVQAVIATAGLEPQTPASITTFPALLDDLAATRERGYAVDHAEHQPGSYCVAATIFDFRNRPIGAISLSGRAIEPLLVETDNLRHTAEVITHVCGKQTGR